MVNGEKTQRKCTTLLLLDIVRPDNYLFHDRERKERIGFLPSAVQCRELLLCVRF